MFSQTQEYYPSGKLCHQKPPSILFMTFWKCSGALAMPNRSLLKQYRPNGVMNVVRSRDSSLNGICQNSLLASSLENSCAPESKAKVTSTFGRRYTSRRTHSFSGLRSTQILRLPIFFWHSNHGSTPFSGHINLGYNTMQRIPFL